MMEPKRLVLGEQIVEAGEKKMIRMLVGHLPSGTRIYIHIHVNRSSNLGPTVLLIGGIHGDEINGIEIVRQAGQKYTQSVLQKGTLITIPLLNVYGFIHFTREVTGGKDVNRSFPGNAKGSLAARIARLVYKKILPQVDMLIDFHTGSHQRYNYPQVRYTKNDLASISLAEVFRAPFMLASPVKPSSLRQYATKMKIPNLAFEGGEAGRFDGFSIEKGLQGIRLILEYLHMLIPGIGHVQHTSLSLAGDTWVRAPYSGIFLWQRSSGIYVKKGEVLGFITDPDNIRIEYIKAKTNGYLIGHNNAPVVHVGDALFHLGW